MVFARISTYPISQVNDGVRIDASKTIFQNISEISDVLINPDFDDDSDNYISVFREGEFTQWYLDWVYISEGSKTAKVKVVLSDESEKEDEAVTSVVTVANDALFSNDSDIIEAEPEIYNHLPNGRTSFTYLHREAQRRILAHLDEQKIWKNDGTRFDKSDFVSVDDKEDFRNWSRFLVLHLIFLNKVVSPDDIYAIKSEQYLALMTKAKDRAVLRIDKDGDGVADHYEDRVTSIQVRR